MKKKKLLQIPPIPLRDAKNTFYRLVADTFNIAGELHLVCDIYQRCGDGKSYEYIRRAAYTFHDWILYYPKTGEWKRRSIENWLGNPEYDQCGEINVPDAPKKPGWKNTEVDDQTAENVCAFWNAQKDNKDPFTYDGSKTCIYLENIERQIKAERKRKASVSRTQKLQERLQLVPAIPEDFEEWADRELWLNREYIYYKRKGRWATCTCSKCGQTYKILTKRSDSYEGQFESVRPVPANNNSTTCEICHAQASYKPIGRVKTTMRYGESQTAYLIQPLKDDGTVVRCFRMDKEWGVGLKSKVSSLEYGRMFFRSKGKVCTDWHLYNNYSGRNEWCDHNICGMSNLSMQKGKVYTANMAEWTTAALKYSGLKRYIEAVGEKIRPGRYLEKAIAWPLEKLVKMDMIELVNHIIELDLDPCKESGRVLDDMYSNDASRMLGIRPCRLSWLQSMQGDHKLLRIMQAEKENTKAVIAGTCTGKGEWTKEQIAKLYNLNLRREPLTQALQYMSVTRFINRVERYCGGTVPDQVDGWECSCRLTRFQMTAGTYLDYISMRVEAGYPLVSALDQAPKDLQKAHDEMELIINKMENERRAEEYEKKYPEVRKRFRALKKRYGWTHEGLIIRPAKCPLEFIEESAILHICVGLSDTYIKSHARGDSTILFMRHANDPNAPYITVEFDGKKIVQWQGINHSNPDRETIEKWLEEWKAEVKRRAGETVGSVARSSTAGADGNILASAV